MGTGGAILTP